MLRRPEICIARERKRVGKPEIQSLTWKIIIITSKRKITHKTTNKLLLTINLHLGYFEPHIGSYDSLEIGLLALFLQHSQVHSEDCR